MTLGGDFGWLMRQHGLALGNLLSIDVVTFSGMRGTHSNLGVVTSFEYRLHPVGPMVMAGMVLHPLEKGREALRFYRDYTSQATDPQMPEYQE